MNQTQNRPLAYRVRETKLLLPCILLALYLLISAIIALFLGWITLLFLVPTSICLALCADNPDFHCSQCGNRIRKHSNVCPTCQSPLTTRKAYTKSTRKLRRIRR
jgi:hypothetical protein